MLKRFKFTNKSIKAIPANPCESRSTELEVADNQVQGLKCSVDKVRNKSTTPQ